MSIKRFDPVIYPQKLWISVENDFKKLNGLFSDPDDNNDFDFGKYDNYKAITAKALEKETRDFGVLIIFRPKYLDCRTIAHEASHAAGYIFQHINAYMDCGEPTAYLIEWIADCCWQCRKKTK